MEKTGVNKQITEFVSRNKKDFYINKMSAIEIDELVEFNKTVYKEEFNAARFSNREGILKIWNWKYKDNPTSKNIINFGWLSRYKNNLIGQFHFIPANIKIGNKYYRCAWGSDLAILKEFRKLGLSTFLVQHVREEISDDFSLFLIGGTNEASYKIFKKSGFIDLGRIPRYLKILDVKSLLKSYRIPAFLSAIPQKMINIKNNIFSLTKAAQNKSISTETVDSANEEFDEFWNSVSRKYECITKRDMSFVKWRYFDQPLWPYTIFRVNKLNIMKGFAVVREGEIKSGRLKGKRIGIISDILINPQERKCTAILLKTIIEFFKKKKTLLIKCDILNKQIQRTLLKMGFIVKKSKNTFMLNIYNHKLPQEAIHLASARKNWFITSGDSDFDFD